MPTVSWKTLTDSIWFIFLVLTEIILKLLHHPNVIMIMWHWPITVGHQWPPDLLTILTAMSKQKSTISKTMNGTTLLIILLARKYLFMIWAFLIYSPTFSRYTHYSVSSTNQAAFFIGGFRFNGRSTTIAKYANDEWSFHGNLKRPRYGHGSIVTGTKTMVIGGYTTYES